MRWSLKVAALGLAVVCLSETNVQAQDTLLPIDADRVALAQRLVDDAKMARTMSFLVDAMMRPLIQQLNAGAEPTELKTYMVALLKSEIADMEVQVRPKLAEIYARTFTDEQLHNIIAFYESPTGQTLLAKQPMLAREGQAAVGPLVPAMQHDMIDKLFAHVCETQHCTPAQREQLTAVKANILAKLAAQQSQPPLTMPAQ